MGEALRIRGEEMQLRIVKGADIVTSITSISSFNDNMILEIKQDGFIGEKFDRFDMVMSGYKGDFEFQPNNSDWYSFETSIQQAATREDPTIVFNLIKTQFFANGQTAIITFKDVKFGNISDAVAGRKEFSKVKMEWSCSERDLDTSGII